MDAATTRHFLFTNVTWPSEHFFVPPGGLELFLHENLRYKVFLVMTAFSPDVYTTYTIKVFAPGQREEARHRVKDIVEHMFFAAHIRQNKFCRSYGAIPMPGESAWMFHVILVLIHAIGFEGEDALAKTEEVPGRAIPTECSVAIAQATFFMNAALSTYLSNMRLGVPAALDYGDFDPHGRILRFFVHRVHPLHIPPIPTMDENFDESVLAKVINEWRWEDDFPVNDAPGRNVPPEEVLAAEMAGLATIITAALRRSEEPAPKTESPKGKKNSSSRRSRRLFRNSGVASESDHDFSSRVVASRISKPGRSKLGSAKSSSSSKTPTFPTAAVYTWTPDAGVHLEADGGEPSSCESMPALQTISDSSASFSD
ncbi:hypothetical protein DFH09DRAFT_1328193 [Mycena vulgaris]|nr:hypothetical protein DFH09DRAFT_1328193 [Mycena vulgaris]